MVLEKSADRNGTAPVVPLHRIVYASLQGGLTAARFNRDPLDSCRHLFGHETSTTSTLLRPEEVFA